MGKINTPEWILEGYDSPAAWRAAKGGDSPSKPKSKPKKKAAKKSPVRSDSTKTFKVRQCPECGSDEVKVVVGEEAKGMWECFKCKWKGKDVGEREMNEEEFMAYLDSKGEEVA